MNSIKADQPGKTPQHHILQGLRGMGKTTLMYRVYYQVLKEYRKKGLVPVIFGEEQYSIRTLYKLWEQVARFLEDNEPDYSGTWYQMQDIQDHEDYEEKCFELLQKSIKKNKHRLLLFIDNFGVMVDKFTKREQQRFREILTTFPGIKILGGSAAAMESFYKYDKPFFDFFNIMQLGSLTSEEVRRLLFRLGEKHKTERVKEIVENQPGRIESLRILTGGVPRTIVLLFNIFLDTDHGNSIEDLKELLDVVTPFYIHRMDELPVQQQEIVDKLALNWDGMSVSELVRKTRMESKALSAQLNNLVKSGVVSTEKSTGKNRYYQLEERFFNIWYLMQHAPKSARQKVIWLTRFLEFWCTGKMLEDTATDFTRRLQKERLHPEYVKAMTYAYARAHGLSLKLRDDIIEAARTALKNKRGATSDDLPLSFDEFDDKFIKLVKEKKSDQARALIEHASLPDAVTNGLLGVIYGITGKLKEAEQHYIKAVKKEDTGAMYNLALLYQDQYKDYKKAEKYYLMAVKKGFTGAMHNLALLYHVQYKDYKKAEKYYLMAVKKEFAKAMNNLALLYKKQFKDYKKAEKYYLMAVKKEDTGAMCNLALLYEDHYKDYKKAEKYYLMAVKKEDAGAMFNLALLYKNHYKDYKKTEKYYLMAMKKEDARAMFNLALLYEDQYKDYKKAEKCYLMAVKKENAGAMCNLALLYHAQYKDYKKAEKYYLMAVKKEHSKAMSNLGLLYKDHKKDYKRAEKYYLMAIMKGEKMALNNMINLIIERNNDQYAKDAKLWIDKLLKTDTDGKSKLLKVRYLLWINESEDAATFLEKVLPDVLEDEEYAFLLSDLLAFAIAKGLRQYVLKLFQREQYQLKDRFKVLYYALMKLLENEYPNEIKKMGKELEEPVTEMVKYIKGLERKYL